MTSDLDRLSTLQTRAALLFEGRWRNGMVVTDGVGRWRMVGDNPKKLVRVPLVPFAGTTGKREALYPDLQDLVTQFCLRDLVRELLHAPEMHPEVEGSPEEWIVVVRVEGYPPFYGRSAVEVLIVAGEHGKRKDQA